MVIVAEIKITRASIFSNNKVGNNFFRFSVEENLLFFCCLYAGTFYFFRLSPFGRCRHSEDHKDQHIVINCTWREEVG